MKPESCHIKIFDRVTDINRGEWKSIFPEIAESYNFFKTLDESLFPQFKSRYICIYEGTQIVCAAPCFVVNYPLDTTIEGPLKKLASKLTGILPRLFTLRVLLCGNPARQGRIGLKDTIGPETLETLENTMRSIAHKEHCRIVAFKDFSQEYASFFAPLLKLGFHKMQSYPSVELDIKFKSFEEYLSSLSKITRKDMQKKFRKLEQKNKIDMEVTGKLGESLDEAYGLYLQTLHKSDVQFERLTREFFKNIEINMPGETRYFLWRINGRLVAFDLCLVSGDVLVDEYIGMDYAVAYEYHLYYVTYRDIITWCIQNNIRLYESGALNYDPKKRLDLRFVPQYLYVKHVHPIFNVLLGILCLMLKPENFDPVLKSMKKPENEKN